MYDEKNIKTPSCKSSILLIEVRHTRYKQLYLHYRLVTVMLLLTNSRATKDSNSVLISLGHSVHTVQHHFFHPFIITYAKH
jgi:hypothetical protein